MAKHFCLGAVCVVEFLLVGCGGPEHLPLPTQPIPSTPTPAPVPPTPAPAAPREIVVGQVVDGDFSTSVSPCGMTNRSLPWCQLFVLTAPRSGTLSVRVDYDAFFYDIILSLKIDDTVFEPQGDPWSPVAGRLSVAAGNTHQIAVAITGDGNGFPVGKFRLTTAIE